MRVTSTDVSQGVVNLGEAAGPSWGLRRKSRGEEYRPWGRITGGRGGMGRGGRGGRGLAASVAEAAEAGWVVAAAAGVRQLGIVQVTLRSQLLEERNELAHDHRMCL